MSHNAGHGGGLPTALPGRRTWIEAVVILVLVGLAGFTLWYRTVYNVWPSQGASGQVHWCGRDYQYQGPAVTHRQALAQAQSRLEAEGSYPPLGVSTDPLYAAMYPGAPHSPTCATLIFLQTGLDVYKPYALEGGP